MQSHFNVKNSIKPDEQVQKIVIRFFLRVLREQFQNKLPNSFQTKEDITAIEPIPNRKSFH